MLKTLYSFGIIPSRSRPKVSNDNPYAESIFKTLKYVPDYQPEGFATLTEARLWVKRFVEWKIMRMVTVELIMLHHQNDMQEKILKY